MTTLLDRIRWLRSVSVRLWRLIIFGFEQIVVSRMLEGRRPLTESLTAVLLKRKGIELHSPELSVRAARGSVDHWSHGFSAINAALFLNLRNPDALSPLRHARPAPAFRGIYLWDSAFIAQVWKWWDVDVAYDVLEAVLRARDGDRLQHFVSEFSRSSLTQPPLLAWSLAKLGEAAPAAAHQLAVAKAYRPLRAYHEWMKANRRLSNGLYAWAHAYESGVENAPRFGDREERRLRDTRAIAAPDLCAYVVLQCEALAAMAVAMGAKNDAAALRAEAETLRDEVNATLWDDEEGLYFDRCEGRFIRTQTIASLMPLWAGIPDKKRASRMIERVLDPGGFNTLIPLPSVAIDDPAFERDMWRGPVWINTAYAVIEGVKRYGHHAVAADLAYRLCDGVYRTYDQTGRFYEFYDPTAYGVKDLNRKRGNRWKAMTLGKKPVIDFVGWTGLVNTIVLETLFGLRNTERGPVMQPRFPKRAEGRAFSLSLPLWDVRIDLDVEQGGAVQGSVSGAIERRFQAEFGDLVRLAEPQRTQRGAVA